MPKGGSIMVMMPKVVISAVLGMTRNSPRMSSIFREPIFCSIAPTQRKSNPLEMA
jgi:hypothetical protein